MALKSQSRVTYNVKLSIGSPPQPLEVIFDTGPEEEGDGRGETGGEGDGRDAPRGRGSVGGGRRQDESSDSLTRQEESGRDGIETGSTGQPRPQGVTEACCLSGHHGAAG